MEGIEFQCDHCNVMFVAPLFCINQTRERLVKSVSGGLPCLDIDAAEAVVNFCSAACRQAELEEVMAAYGVPIPDVRPDIGPDEVCAVCSGPADVTIEHMAFSVEEIDLTKDEPTPVNFAYLALVCAECATKVNFGRLHTNASLGQRKVAVGFLDSGGRA